jgi:hypothetical protein
MATIAFTLGAAAIGGPGGAALGLAGAFIGGILDQKFIYPALFGSTSKGLTTPRISGVELQHFDDGAPANILKGRTIRAAGTVIWLGDQVVRNRSSGAVEIYQSVAVAFCRNEINKYLEIYAGGEKLFRQISLDTQTGNVNFYTGTITRMRIEEVAGGIDLSRYGLLDSIVITGTNAGTWVVNRKWIENGTTRLEVTITPGYTTGTFSVTIAPETATFATTYESMNTHLGTSAQTADSIISGEESNTPGFRGTAYIVIENLRLDLYGGGIPTFSALIEEDATKTGQEFLEDIRDLAGLSGGEFDASDYSAEVFRGIGFSGLNRPKDILGAFAVAYNANIRESGGAIVIEKRSSADTITIPAADIGANAALSESNPRLASFSDAGDTDLPKEVNVYHLSPTLDYQQGVAKERLLDSFVSRVETINLPFVLTDDEARDVAQRILWVTRSERIEIVFFVGLKYIEIEPGDQATITIESETYTVRVEKVLIGKNGVIEVRSVVEDSETATQDSTTDSLSSFVTTTPPMAQALEVKILDIPAVFEADVLDPVLYFAVYTLDTHGFMGAFVYESSDETNWKLKFVTAQDNVIGEADTVLATVTDTTIWDETNTVDVTVFDGSLQSTTEARVVEDRENMALLGTEIIYFKTATVIGTNEYRLSGLIRGARNTEDQVGTHATDEVFVLLNSNIQDDVGVIPMTFSDAGRPRYFNVVGVNSTAGEGETYDITPNIASLRPFSPIDVIGLRDGSNNLTIEWTRRSRSFGAELNDGGTPLVDDLELYDVEILDGPAGSVLRTFSDVTVNSQVYTAAQQTTDGLTPGDPVDVKIYQISPIYGRGKGEEEEV